MKKHFLLLIVAFLFLQLTAKEPVGYYYIADGKKGEDLKTALFKIVSQAKMLSYGGGEGKTWEGFFATDRIATDDKVWDMYSNDTFYQKSFASVVGMHIEHSLPKSWWGTIENNAYKDLFHLYPAEGNINMRKSNLPLGETADNAYTNGVSRVGMNTFGDTYAGNSFEPADEYKGDFARSYLYVVTAYQNMANNWVSPMMNNNTYPVWQKWAIDLLLKWHRNDPVSEKELARIEQVYNIQGNRNPYIDYPDLVEHIWGNAKDKPYKFPEEKSAFISIPNRWNAIDYGAVMLNSVNSKAVSILGSHLTMPLNLSLSGKYAGLLSISTNTISAEDVNKGIDISIALNATLKTVINDVLIMSSDEIGKVEVPISAIISNEFLSIYPTEISATTATLRWMNISNDKDYKVSLYSGEASQAGDLFISVYLEGSSNNKALELYNATGHSIDLSNYSLKIQGNGNGEFENEVLLSGIVENNSSFIIVNQGEFGSADQGLIDKANVLLPLAFNGNDAVALYNNNMQIDVIGIVNEVATWGEDITFVKKTSNPQVVFNIQDWNVLPINSFDALNTYKFTPPTTPATKIEDFIVKDNKLDVKDLNPAQIYHYVVTNDNTTTTHNIMHFYTHKLEVPAALSVLNVMGTEFDVSWEDVSGAKSYKFELSEMNGPGYTTEVTDFTGVGVNGKPLPESWTGTASGNYTTATSYGLATPSLAFKDNGEYITSKSFTYPIASLTFMYRFPSAGSGNAILVEGFSTDKWVTIDKIAYVNTQKYYPLYTFDSKDNITAIRITFIKAKGNLAIDDIEIKSGQETAITTEHDVNGLEYTPTGLKKLTRYKCRVKAIHPMSQSEYSEPLTVTTTDVSSVNNIDKDANLSVTITNGLIKVESSNEMINSISLYSVMGQLINRKHINAQNGEINTNQRGVYILDIEMAKKHKSVKIIL